MNPLDDPLAVIRPRQIKEAPPPDFRDSFWRQVPDMRPTVAREVPATLNRCVFDTTNRRAYHGRTCPHLCKDGQHTEGICPHGQ